MLTGNPIHILLVEDDDAHAEIVRRSLADFRVANQITHVEDGQAALDYLHHQDRYAAPGNITPARSNPAGLAPAEGGRLQVLARLKTDRPIWRESPPSFSPPPAPRTTWSRPMRRARAVLGQAGGIREVPGADGRVWLLLLAWNRYPHPTVRAPSAIVSQGAPRNPTCTST